MKQPLSRRHLLQAGGAAAMTGSGFLVSGQAHAQSQTLRLGHVLAPAHPFHQGLELAAKKLAEASNGRFKLQVFPSSQLESLWGGILGIFKKSIIYSIIRDYEIATHPYYGKNICITGALSKPREEYKYLLEKIGAKVVSTVTSKTDFLVCNEASSSSKYKEAQKLPIPVVTEEEFALKL